MHRLTSQTAPLPSIAAGNPCRVIRKITDADKRKLFGKEEIDEEAWNDIVSRMQF